MGISSIVGTTSIGPAVCTSSTRPASPYEGQMIYETDTNRVLVYNNTAWVMIADTDTPPGLQLIKSTTVSSSTASVFMSDVFSSEFESYHINIKMRALNEGSYQIAMGNTTSNTSGWYGAVTYWSYTGAPDGVVRFSNSATGNVGLSQNSAWSMTSMDMWNPYLADYTLFSGTYWGRERYIGNVGGELATTTSYTGFTFLNDAGNLSAGRIDVYGYRQ